MAVGGAVALLVASAPAAAQAARTSISLFSDPDSFIGSGVQRLYTPRNAEIHVKREYGWISIEVNYGEIHDSFTLKFAAPPGQKLHRGVYDYAERTHYLGRPGIDVLGEARGCNETEGRFEVRDIARRPSGAIKRLWLIYEQHCENDGAASFGEVRIREGHRLAMPSVVRWPAGEHGSIGTAVPVTFSPSSRPVAFRRARVAGKGRNAFRVTANECSGKTIQPGGACRVWVRFQAGPGTHRGKLRLGAANGRTYGAALDGFNWGGRTRFVMHSDEGDFVGQGLDWAFTPRNSRINRFGEPDHVAFNIYPPGDHWGVDFRMPPGGVLRPHNYTSYPDAGRQHVDVGGSGRGCGHSNGSFEIEQIRFDRRGDRLLRNFAASFVQHCEGGEPALRGRIDFRAGDRTKPAPWMERPGS